MANSLLVPSVSIAESLALMKDAMPTQTIDLQQFKAISKRFIWRGTVFVTLPIIALLFSVLPHNEIFPYLIITAVFIFLTAIIALRWMRWGYSFDGEYLYIRKGFLGVNYYCFPVFKVQQAHLKQNVFIRPYQLASLKLILASGAHQIPYMPAKEVQAIVNSILDLLVTDKRSWM
jgi:putative membrane protein